MKNPKYLLLLLLMLVMQAMMFAVSTTIDFEPAGQGATWTWVMDQNGSNPALQFPANPVSGGINTSATVAKFTALQIGQPWALCYTDDIDPFQFNATNSTVKIMVYKPVLSPVTIKFEAGSTPAEIQVTNTVINQWEELSFNFSASIGNTYSRLVIIPDFVARTQDNLMYFDNIQIPEGNVAPPAEPTVAAPIPTVPAEDVVSIFSNSYTNLTGTNFSPGWGQTTIVTTPNIAGNTMLKYASFNFQGTQLSASVDLSAMDFLHVDMWTENATVVKVSPIAAPPAENLLSLTPIVAGSWNSYDIPLTAFTGVPMNNIYQLKFDGQAGVSPSTIYLDNIYFYSSALPGNDATLSDLKVNGTTVAGFSPSTLSYNSVIANGSPLPTLAGTTTDPNASIVINQATSVPGSGTIVVTAEDNLTTRTYTVNFTWGDTFPTVAPTEPFHDSEDVISIYSDYYNNVSGTNFNPFWGQLTTVTVDYQVAGINTIRYQNLNYQGTEYSPQDVSAYEAIHLDFWTLTSTSLSFFLISPGAETAYSLPITAGQWVSVDIPLRSFVPPVNLANAFQFKVVGNGEVWFTNLFFWKEPIVIGSDATLSDLKVDGSTVTGFAPLTENYVYPLLEGTTVPPQITSVSLSDPNASYVITQATAVPGTASVQVTAQNLSTTKTYTVAFSIVYPNSVPPVPMHDAGAVISLFSDAYTDVPVDTWLTPWSQATLEDVQIAGNPVKKYTAVNFVGIETTGANLLDVTALTHLHIDMWTPEANDFRVKLVDWGVNGVWGGGDDTEHELIYPAPATGSWISYDIPLSSFTNLSLTGNMAQYVLSKPTLGTMYLDNIYFYAAAPAGPANVSIITTVTGIELSWDAIPGASSYQVYASDNPYGPFAPVLGGVYSATGWTSTATASRKFYHVTAISE